MDRKFDAIVIGSSTGGLHALRRVLSVLPSDFSVPIGIVQHREAGSEDLLAGLLDSRCALDVVCAVDKQEFNAGIVCIAPANYHMLIEDKCTLALSVDARVNFARPAIDVLFETAAHIFSNRLIGVVLTGASNDGSLGLKAVRGNGGYAIVQNPLEAKSSMMPDSAIKTAGADEILKLDDIGIRLTELCKTRTKREPFSKP